MGLVPRVSGFGCLYRSGTAACGGGKERAGRVGVRRASDSESAFARGARELGKRKDGRGEKEGRDSGADSTEARRRTRERAESGLSGRRAASPLRTLSERERRRKEGEEGDDRRGPPVGAGREGRRGPARSGPRGSLGRGEEKEKERRSWAGGEVGPKEGKERKREKGKIFPGCSEFGKFWRDANDFEFKL